MCKQILVTKVHGTYNWSTENLGFIIKKSIISNLTKFGSKLEKCIDVSFI